MSEENSVYEGKIVLFKNGVAHVLAALPDGFEVTSTSATAGPRQISVTSSEYRDRRLNFWRAQDTCADPLHFANMDLSAANGLLLQAGLAWTPEPAAEPIRWFGGAVNRAWLDLRSPEPPVGFIAGSGYAAEAWAWLRRRAGLEEG